jgi:phosphoribosylformylglycinamidine cyclo-ligase
MQDKLPGSTLKVGEALLSPTRTYAPLLSKIIKDGSEGIAAIFHNTGGGQTKCLRFGTNLTYIKDDLFPMPPLFKALREKSRLDLRELYRSLNMGHRLEIACEPSIVSGFISIAKGFGIDAKVVGRTESGSGRNRLILKAEGETLEYSLD